MAGYRNSIEEKLIVPALKIATLQVYGKNEHNLSFVVSLSNNTVQTIIEDMAKNIEETVASKIQKSMFFSLQ